MGMYMEKVLPIERKNCFIAISSRINKDR
jgi:hypothetical protein